jgi:group I intron endonuclease
MNTSTASTDLSSTGVYCIFNKINNKFYIGSTSVKSKYPSMSGFNYRWRTHKCLLKNNKHHNKHLQNSWNKYGESNFVFKVLEIVDPQDCFLMEELYIQFSNSKFLYNKNTQSNTLLGFNHSEASKQKMSDSKSQNFLLCDPGGEILSIKNLNSFAKEKI